MLSKGRSVGSLPSEKKQWSLNTYVQIFDWWPYIDGQKITADLISNWVDRILIITCRYGKYECSLDEYDDFEGNMDDFVRHHVLALRG